MPCGLIDNFLLISAGSDLRKISVIPIILILLSMFRKGLEKLTSQYEDERLQSEANIKEQLKKIADTDQTETIDLSNIKKNVQKLEKIKNDATKKLAYLSPKEQTFRLFTLYLLSFVGVTTAIVYDSQLRNETFFILFISAACFAVATFILWKMFCVMVEAKQVLDDEIKSNEIKLTEISLRSLELLSAIANKPVQEFLSDVWILVNNTKIKDKDSKISLPLNTESNLAITISNKDLIMAKNVEIGFIFPPDIIINKKKSYSLYADEKKQIVRYHQDSIQGSTSQILATLDLTPMTEGDHSIKTFIKGENIKAIYRDIVLNVSKPKNGKTEVTKAP